MRKNPFIKYLLQFTLFWLLLSCAAEAPASGGPEDTRSPRLVEVTPANETTALPTDAKIILKFDESIDPLSVPAAVQIDPDVAVTVKSRWNVVTLTADRGWPENSLIRINLTRSVRDYQNNEIEMPIQLIYSTGFDIPEASIAGQLQGIDPEKKVELGLYAYPVSDSSRYLMKIQAAMDGRWQFSHLRAGTYVVCALEGELKDFGADYREFRYAMLNTDHISLTDSSQLKEVKMLMSEPPERLSIKSIDFQNKDFINLTFSDGSEESLSLREYLGTKGAFSPGDTLTLFLDRTNRLERYKMTPYSFVVPEISDTIPPAVGKHYFSGYYYHINFTEPVFYIKDTTYALPLFVEGIIDTETTIYYTKWLNNRSLEISDIRPNTESLRFSGYDFYDTSGNFMADSIVTLKVNWQGYPQHLPTGDILGAVRYQGLNSLMVSATNLESDSSFYAEPEGANYVLKRLPPGVYRVQAYEKLNDVNPQLYFSGLWSPYRPAARLAAYPDTVEVRARWSVEGVDLEF
ncbi:MAG: Ig-like domain-containing protein [FCB group bacterium]|nr:Ig-like domain-containing protein [FCB group bacterium]